MLRPKISVVMPVFNCEATLETAVRSVIAQSFEDWELLILDDGSVDETVRVAEMIGDPRVRVVKDEAGNRGLSFRLNQGVELARGDVVARMDGDDISFPDRFARQLEFLQRSGEIDLVGCSMVLFKGAGEMTGLQRTRTTHKEICGSAMRSCLLPHATWMGRTRWFRENRYDDRRRRAEDRELLLRTRERSRFAGIDEVMYGYRVDRVSLVKNAMARREYAEALWQDGVRRGKRWEGMLASGAELAKLAIDTVALSTGTERWVLRHRQQATSDETIASRWMAVWKCVESPTAVAS